MKKSILVFILLLALLTACSNRTETSVDAPPQAYTQLDEGVWPVNAYTDGLPVPPGTVAWVMIDAERKNCSIGIEDIAESEFDDYLNRLKQAGFSVVEDVSEKIKGQNYVSVGAILSNGEKGVSVSYVPGNLAIYITKG